MKFIHKYDTEAQFDAAYNGNDYLEPWVSYTRDIEKVNYNKSEEEKLRETPLTFEVLSNGNITWNLYSDDETAETGFTIEYKKNAGEWTEIAAHLVEWIDDETYPSGGYYTGGTEIPVNTGDIVQFRGDNATYYNWDDEAEIESYAFFNSTCQLKAKANIMSLIDSTNFSDLTTLESAYTFYYLFNECRGLTDASNLVLPTTTLVDSCYYGMFYGCTGLTTAPELPATALASYCYAGMFQNCTSLTTAPELPVTTLADGCYAKMFQGCTSLTQAPELPALTLTAYCYSNMFQNCTSLASAPELPATTLASNCYKSMFYGCTGLTTAPELPATTLVDYCYYGMFQGCTSLAQAPELPATTLAQRCYQYMFQGCTRLNYIKAMFTTTPGSSYTVGWVSGVASTGTFVKNASATWTTTGVNGIPNGWTVQTATP